MTLLSDYITSRSTKEQEIVECSYEACSHLNSLISIPTTTKVQNNNNNTYVIFAMNNFSGH
jgi:hypothetical protein